MKSMLAERYKRIKKTKWLTEGKLKKWIDALFYPQPEGFLDQRLLKQTTNPYIAARTEWNFMFNDLIKAKYNWQRIALALIVSNCLLIVGLTMVAKQHKTIPYMVKVDSLGNSSFAGYLTEEKELSPAIINAFVRRYITSARSIIADSVAEKQTLDFVYTTTRGSALSYLNEYYRANEPFKKAMQTTVEIKINAVLPKSSKTWQIEWTEIERNLDGALLNQSQYEALITVNHYPIESAKDINTNPLGLFVTHLSWASQS